MTLTATRIQISNKLPAGWLIFFGLPAVLSLAWGAWFLAGGQLAVGFGWASFGAGCGIAAILVSIWGRQARGEIRVLERGFAVSEANETREYGDAQVESMALSTRPRYRAGHLCGVTHTIVLVLRGEWETETLSFNYKLPIGDFDPLDPFIERVERQLFERADEALARQRTVSGQGWAWERNELHVGPHADQPHALTGKTSFCVDEVSAVETVDGNLCIWKRGEASPVVRIPETAQNCRLLSQLLRSRLKARGAFAPHEGTDGLGRILFERRGSLAPVLLCWFFAICLAAFASAFGALGVLVGGTLFWILAAAFGLVAALLAWWGQRSRRTAFRCHEFGLCRVGPASTRTLRFQDVACVTYRAVRQYVHGAYTGTHMMLTCAPAGGKASSDAITYSTTSTRPDGELLRVRDRVAGIVAGRMFERLASGDTVEWTPSLRFRADALIYQPKRRLRRAMVAIEIPYDAITLFNVEKDRFHLWTNYQERAVVAEDPSEPNFYAGLIVLGRLCHITIGEVV